MLFVNALECPFAQRTWITLLEKGIEFERRDVALRKPDGEYVGDDKPAWWLEMNPLGKVPVLHDAGRSFYESVVCNELLDDLHPDPPLRPDGPWGRARMRLVIERFNQRFVPNFYRVLLRAEERRAEPLAEMFEELDWLETQASTDGPWLCGERFTLADAALAPFFGRFRVLEHYRGLDLLEGRERLTRWSARVWKRPSFVGTRETPGDFDGSWRDYMIEVYETYASGEPASTSAQDFA